MTRCPNKSTPNFSKSCPIIGLSRFCLKGAHFQSSQKSCKVIGLLNLQTFITILSKIAQFGHTGWGTSRPTYHCWYCCCCSFLRHTKCEKTFCSAKLECYQDAQEAVAIFFNINKTSFLNIFTVNKFVWFTRWHLSWVQWKNLSYFHSQSLSLNPVNENTFYFAALYLKLSRTFGAYFERKIIFNAKLLLTLD